MKDLGLIPLRSFAIVVDNHIYRSAQPMSGYEFKWIENLGVKRIVNLRSEVDIDSRFSKLINIETITIPVKEDYPPTDKQAEEFVSLLNDSKDNPLLFHCKHGHGRTSSFCVIARIHQGWTLEKALKEEEKNFHYQFGHLHQLEWLQNYYNEYTSTHAS